MGKRILEVSDVKRICALTLALLLVACLCPAVADEEPEAVARPMLVMENLTGNGGVIIGVVDEDGCVWLSGLEDSGGWSDMLLSEYVISLRRQGAMVLLRRLPYDELFAIKSLVAAVDRDFSIRESPLDTKAVQARSACRYDRDGACEYIILGACGSNILENPSPAAQALYLRLSDLLPMLAWFDSIADASPGGFQPVSVAEFAGLEGLEEEGVTVTASRTDCEEGPSPLSLTEEEADQALALARQGQVTGMVNALSVTGGTVVYEFFAANGDRIGSVTLYQGLLVNNDGMYAYQLPDGEN